MKKKNKDISLQKSARITYLWHRILMGIVFVVSFLGVIFNEDQSVKSEYLFNCVQSGLFLIVSLLPIFMQKLKLDIPSAVYIIFILFCLAHFLLGEILDFYVKVPLWDSILHIFSGTLLALLSFSLVNLLNKSNDPGFKLNMGFTILFAFTLAITLGVLWEIFEFAADVITGSNMQRAYVSTVNGRGEALEGTAALLDTMKDLILDAIGAGIVCAVCAILAYKKRIKLEDLSFIKKAKAVVPASQENVEEVINEMTEHSEDSVEKSESNIDVNTEIVIPETNEVEKETNVLKEASLKKTKASKSKKK